MKRAALFVALAAAALPAHADGDKPTTGGAAVRKPVAKQLAKAAGEAFSAALTADEAGDLKKAASLYERAWKLSPHPNTAYNLGDVARRANHLHDAIRWFEAYLALAPKSADREQVAAGIAALAATPSALLIPEKPIDERETNDEIDIVASYVFVDGVQVSKPGTPAVKTPTHRWPMLVVPVPAGEHVVDVISAVSFGQGIRQHCTTVPGQQDVCSPRMPARVDGNVVVDGYDDELRVHLEGYQWDLVGRRLEMPPGKTAVEVTDWGYECPPLVIDAPADDSVRFIFLKVTESPLVPRCRTLKISQYLLAF